MYGVMMRPAPSGAGRTSSLRSANRNGCGAAVSPAAQVICPPEGTSGAEAADSVRSPGQALSDERALRNAAVHARSLSALTVDVPAVMADPRRGNLDTVCFRVTVCHRLSGCRERTKRAAVPSTG